MLHITITDTETGNVLHEADAHALIGGYKTEKGSDSIIVAQCSDFDLSMAICATENAISAVKKQKGTAFAIATEILAKAIKDGELGRKGNE